MSRFTFSLVNVDGRMVSLDSFPEAKGFIIVFTCNHCPYAIAYEKRIAALNDMYAEKGFPLIAISSNDPVRYPQDSPERMQERAHARGWIFPYLFDETQEVARNYGATHTPHAFVLFRNEERLSLMYQGAIDDNYDNEEAVQAQYVAGHLDALLQQKTGTPSETPAVGCTIKWRL